jgi:hypothetical protein
MMTHEVRAAKLTHYVAQCLPIKPDCSFPTLALVNWRSRLLDHLSRSEKGVPAQDDLTRRALRGIDALVRMHEELDGCGCFYHARQCRIRHFAEMRAKDRTAHAS